MSGNKDWDRQPLFDTENEAWDYIHEMYCQCLAKDPKDKYCDHCEAEWSVESVEEVNHFTFGEFIYELIVPFLAFAALAWACYMLFQAIFFPAYYT